MHFYVLYSCTVPSLPSKLAEDILILICRMIMAISVCSTDDEFSPTTQCFLWLWRSQTHRSVRWAHGMSDGRGSMIRDQKASLSKKLATGMFMSCTLGGYSVSGL